MTPAATLGTWLAGSWIRPHTGGVAKLAKPPSLGSAAGGGGAAIRQATRLRVLSVLVPFPSAEGVVSQPIPRPCREKKLLGMFACLSLLAPSGPKENRTSDEGFLEGQASDSPPFS
jgi:hypothetical protein